MNLSRLRSWRNILFPATSYPVRGTVLGLALVALLVPILNFWQGPNGHLGQSIPLLFLVPVLVASAIGGWAAGTVVSLVAVLVWDWFFIPPFYTVTIASVRDVVALAVFLAVALLTGQLATTARERTREALSRARTTEALYDLSSALIGRHDMANVLSTLAARLRETFDLEACAVLLPSPSDGKWMTVAVAGTLPFDLAVERSRDVAALASWARREGRPCGFGDSRAASANWQPTPTLSRQRAQFLPLRAGDRSIGVLEIVQKRGSWLDADAQRLLTTLANGVAIALEQERLAAEEREAEVARESDRLKSALLSSVSHDLRTPLAGIKAAASSLMQEDVTWSDEDRRAFAADIDSEADRLTRLVSNLLDLSRLEAGALQPMKEWEDVGELIRRVVNRLSPRLADHHIVYDIPLTRAAAGTRSPSSARPAEDLPHVRLDTVQIEQVLSNLIENAAKYSPASTTITVSARAVTSPSGADEMHIAVKDEGPGIPRSEQDKIFDKFYRIAGSSRRAGGTGMGLAIVRGLVEGHGGRVSVESTGGKGTTFTVILPLEQEQGAVSHPDGALPAESAGGRVQEVQS